MEKEVGVPSMPGERMLSIDFFRGITMFLLIGEITAEIITSLITWATLWYMC